LQQPSSLARREFADAVLIKGGSGEGDDGHNGNDAMS
jgi:hypothetical protein